MGRAVFSFVAIAFCFLFNLTFGQQAYAKKNDSVLGLVIDNQNSCRKVRYQRKDWRHWSDLDADCQSTRHEVLISENKGELKFKNSDNCKVATGLWISQFSGIKTTEAKKFDIDHFVPLKNAHISGGCHWTTKNKQSYANDLKHPNALVAVGKQENQDKGASAPDEWRPRSRRSWCWYAKNWISIKRKYHLSVTDSEARALKGMLLRCRTSLNN